VSSDAVTGDGAAGPGEVRIAMWSGPRTVSTALMRSFGNRADTVVVDEPLYGYYLAQTGADHPGRDEVMASMPTDWPTVLTQLVTAPLADAATVFYQKHMTHHLLPDVDRAPLAGLTHAFLIRDPVRLLASYARVRDRPVLADLGLEQQAEIFRTFGGPVIDSADILRGPRPALGALCDALGIGFDPAMLSWPAGPRPTDGVWARYWYDSVWGSTGFGEYTEVAPVDLAPDLVPLAKQCQPFYDELAAHRLRP
jgi:Sulfotransferase domain